MFEKCVRLVAKEVIYEDVFKVCSAGIRTTVYWGYLLGKILTEVLCKVRYGFNTPPNALVWFGTNSNTGTRHFGNFRWPTRNTPPTVFFPTEHTL